MSEGFLRRFDAAMQDDTQLAAATRRLTAALGTADRPMAERNFRAACFTAQWRALWHMLRGTVGATRLMQPANSLRQTSMGG
jgi:hypothetical protein